MIDNNRRKLFKAATAIAAVGTTAGGLPAIASAAGIVSENARTIDAQLVNTKALRGTGLELSFSPIGTSNTQIISIKNTTEAPVTIRHVYPGIVHSNGLAFDINDVLSASSLEIRPGSTYQSTIQAIPFNHEEKPVPTGGTLTNKLKVSTRVLKIDGQQPVVTTRGFMA